LPALSFSGVTSLGPFWKLIRDRLKQQTIRTPRKNPIKVGDRLVLYWKQRTPVHLKKVHLIAYAECIEILTLRYIEFAYDDDIARLDGCTSTELREWFGSPYLYGDKIYDIIRWRLVSNGEIQK